MDLKNITVNGVPVEMVIDEALRVEYRSHRNDELREMSMLAKRPVSSKRNIKNHSGARTSRGRVIYSAAFAGGAA